MRIMFWNTHNNTKINELLCDLIIENDINIVVLAEYKADISELIQALYQEGRIMTEYCTIGCKRITIIGDIKNVKSCYHSNYSSMQLINNDFILCCVHLSSQIFSGNDELREVEASRIIREINSLEETNNTKNTIVVGDFNVDPFDKLMIKPFYFYGQPIYDVSAKEAHKIVEESYYMFYNPMWNMLGDFNRPYGTCYADSNQAVGIYWHIFDQVIIRPNLRERFISNSLKILEASREINLLNDKGVPDKSISDHLPIVFEIKER